MTKRLKFFLPIAVILAAAVVMGVMIKAKPAVERVEREALPPLVRVFEVERGPVPLEVRSTGVVEPATRSTLVAEIGARVASLSPKFAEGAFFDRGEVLLRLDERDFELAVTQAEARVAQAKVQLEREQAEALLATEEWQELGEGEPTALVLREPQLAQARAEVASAEAALEQARLRLDRTRIRAPFPGRVEEKLVDLGQFVGPGTPLGRIYSTERAEVGLEVPQDELAFLDLTLGNPGPLATRALLSGRIGSVEATWPARVVRTGSRIDPATRMISLVAAVDDPFSLAGTHAAPLPMGLYLEARIEGRTVDNAIVVPRAALREDGSVLVVDSEDRLEIREVEVLRRGSEEAVLSSGLEAGERLCVSRLAAVVEGMKVRIEKLDRPPTTEALTGDRS